MPTFRKKPVVIEARQSDGRNGSEIVAWIGAGGVPVISHVPAAEDHIKIKTLEGTMRADKGDWVIKGVRGEFYPCKPNIFEATYEPAG